MDFKKHALILDVVEELKGYESRAGKTHVQKAFSLLNARGDIPIPFQFILYKHGPYSFDIEEEMELMKSYSALISVPVQEFGVMLSSGNMADYVKQRAPLSIEEMKAIKRVCEFVGKRNVLELERISTAAWIRTQENIQDTNKVAQRLHELKPHVTVEDALKADSEALKLLLPS